MSPLATPPFVYTEPPVVEPYLHGLLGVAQELTPPGGTEHWRYGGIEFESLAAYPTATYQSGATTVNGSGGAKALSPCAGSTKAYPFEVYGGVATGSLGHNENGNAFWDERARSIVELAGQHSAEVALWTGSAGASPAFNAASTPLILPGQANTGTGAVDLVTGISVAESYLASHYAGRGIIHAPRGVAPYLAQLQQLRQDVDNEHVLTTPLGTKFAFGGGYDGTGPGAVTPPAMVGSQQYFWLYVTGQVAYIRSEIDTPGNFGEALNRANNQVALLAEQAWLIAVDTVIAAVLVKSQTIS